MNERRALGLVPLLFGIWFFGVLAPYGIQVGEDGDMLYQAYATWRGQLPYLDFSTGYTPLYFYWHALLFRIFGVDALVIRISTAVANTLTLVLMYHLAARLVRPRLALLAPLVFLAGLQVFPGEFCAFNIPYPAWYNITLWLGSVAAMAAYAERPRLALVVLAGLLAGASFSVKPNVGLFNVATLGLFLVWWQPPGRADGRLARLAWWLLALGTYTFVLIVFRAQLLTRAFVLFPLPVLVVLVLLLVNAQERRRDGSGFLGAALALAFGVAVPILPWSLYFLAYLGFDGFLRDVLLIGTSYERFFFVAYRPVGTVWDVGILVVGAALLLVPLLVKNRLLPAWLPLAAAVGAAAAAALYLGAFAPMRSGFVASLTMRMHDLSFFALQVVNWWAVWLAVRRLSGADHRAAERSPRLAALVLLIVSAPAFTLGMYPRSDFAHLITVAPAAIILGVVLLGRIGERWGAMAARGTYWRWAGPTLVAVPVAAIALVMATPSLRLAADVSARVLGLRGPNAFAHLDLGRASLVREAESKLQFEVLHDTATYLEAHSEPREYVFPFPNLSLLCFLAGRLNPTPKGYFIAGYPDHETEAGIVRALVAHPPRLVVSLRDHELFVTTASMYYFLVREAVQSEFTPAVQIGPYAILARRGPDAPAFADPLATPPLEPDRWAGLDDPDLAVQLATAERIRAERDARGAAALTRRAARGTPYAQRFIQLAAEFGDERALPPLVEIVAQDRASERPPTPSPEGELAMSALYFIVDKAVLADYWFVPPPLARRRAVAEGELDATVMNAWLRDRNADLRLRIAAAWAAAWRNDREAVPYLLVMLGSSELEAAKAAAYALVRMGHLEATIDSLVALMYWDDLRVPSLVLDLYRHDPERVRPAVAAALRHGNWKTQVALTWVAAASGDLALLPVLADVRDASEPGLKRAAEAAIAVLDTGGHRAGAS